MHTPLVQSTGSAAPSVDCVKAGAVLISLFLQSLEYIAFTHAMLPSQDHLVLQVTGPSGCHRGTVALFKDPGKESKSLIIIVCAHLGLDKI